MSAFSVYYAAREQDLQAFKNDSAILKGLDQTIRADLGRLYRLLDAVDARIAEIDEPVKLPRGNRRTDFQRGYDAGLRAARGVAA